MQLTFTSANHNGYKRLVAALVIMFMGLSLFRVPVFAQDVSVRAELSSSTITRDESVVLTITAIGIDSELDASSLSKDFEVIGRSSSRQISTVIGSNNQAMNTSVVTWALELLPIGEGVFTVPSVKVGNYETQLLSLIVNAVPKGAKRDIFLEASVDNTTPWVQSQVLMTLRVFQAIDIVDGGLNEPAADDLVVQRLGDDTRTREVRDGREYSVTERRFALFPQKSGDILIDPVTLSITVPADPNRVRGFFSPTRKLTRLSDAITLNVQARPPSGSGWWLPAQNVSLQAQWQGEKQTAQVDQPLTRTIIMRAEGVLDSQLPQINIPAIDGLSLYAEDPKLSMSAVDSGLVAEQRINWALIPQRGGTLTLPAISVEWFNTLTGERETAELSSETIEVMAPDTTGSNQNPVSTPDGASSDGLTAGLSADTALRAEPESQVLSPPESTQNDSLKASNINLTNDRVVTLETALQRWQLLAYIVIALWMLTVVAWLLWRKRASGTLPGSAASGEYPSRLSRQNGITALYQHHASFNGLEKACAQGDISEIKHSLLEWSSRQWPADSPITLDAIQVKLPEGAARETLARIQAALYSEQGNAASKPSLAADLNKLPGDLKVALQNTGSMLAVGRETDSAANDVELPKNGISRLPPL
ncbi:MAG: BatD family protein [Granulosicoccus sp.]